MPVWACKGPRATRFNLACPSFTGFVVLSELKPEERWCNEILMAPPRSITVAEFTALNVIQNARRRGRCSTVPCISCFQTLGDGRPIRIQLTRCWTLLYMALVIVMLQSITGLTTHVSDCTLTKAPTVLTVWQHNHCTCIKLARACYHVRVDAEPRRATVSSRTDQLFDISALDLINTCEILVSACHLNSTSVIELVEAAIRFCSPAPMHDCTKSRP